MNSDTASATLLGPLAIVLVCLGLLWAVAVPHTVSPLTYLLLAGAAGTVITVAAMTYRNGQAPATMAQILQDADTDSSDARTARPKVPVKDSHGRDADLESGSAGPPRTVGAERLRRHRLRNR